MIAPNDINITKNDGFIDNSFVVQKNEEIPSENTENSFQKDENILKDKETVEEKTEPKEIGQEDIKKEETNNETDKKQDLQEQKQEEIPQEVKTQTLSDFSFVPPSKQNSAPVKQKTKVFNLDDLFGAKKEESNLNQGTKLSFDENLPSNSVSKPLDLNFFDNKQPKEEQKTVNTILDEMDSFFGSETKVETKVEENFVVKTPPGMIKMDFGSFGNDGFDTSFPVEPLDKKIEIPKETEIPKESNESKIEIQPKNNGFDEGFEPEFNDFPPVEEVKKEERNELKIEDQPPKEEKKEIPRVNNEPKNIGFDEGFETSFNDFPPLEEGKKDIKIDDQPPKEVKPIPSDPFVSELPKTEENINGNIDEIKEVKNNLTIENPKNDFGNESNFGGIDTLFGSEKKEQEKKQEKPKDDFDGFGNEGFDTSFPVEPIDKNIEIPKENNELKPEIQPKNDEFKESFEPEFNDTSFSVTKEIEIPKENNELKIENQPKNNQFEEGFETDFNDFPHLVEEVKKDVKIDDQPPKEEKKEVPKENNEPKNNDFDEGFETEFNDFPPVEEVKKDVKKEEFDFGPSDFDNVDFDSFPKENEPVKVEPPVPKLFENTVDFDQFEASFEDSDKPKDEKSEKPLEKEEIKETKENQPSLSPIKDINNGESQETPKINETEIKKDVIISEVIDKKPKKVMFQVSPDKDTFESPTATVGSLFLKTPAPHEFDEDFNEFTSKTDFNDDFETFEQNPEKKAESKDEDFDFGEFETSNSTEQDPNFGSYVPKSNTSNSTVPTDIYDVKLKFY